LNFILNLLRFFNYIIGYLHQFRMKNLLISIFSLYEFLLNPFINVILWREKKFPEYKRPNERPLEYAFALRAIAKYYPAQVLDIGTGKTAFPHIVYNCGLKITAIDKIDGYWGFGLVNRHFPIINMDITKAKWVEKFDLVTCISTLEHIPDFDEAVAAMAKTLKVGGHLLITVPFNKNVFFEDIYKHPEGGYGKDFKFIGRIYTAQNVTQWSEANHLELAEAEYYRFFTGKYWTQGEPILPPVLLASDDDAQLACLLLKKK